MPCQSWTQICPVFANSVDLDQLVWRNQLTWIYIVLHSVCKFISTICIKTSDWLKIRNGCGSLIYSAWQGLKCLFAYVDKHLLFFIEHFYFLLDMGTNSMENVIVNKFYLAKSPFPARKAQLLMCFFLFFFFFCVVCLFKRLWMGL